MDTPICHGGDVKLSQLDSTALLNNLHTGVVVHEPNTQIRYANPKALELLRLTYEQALGKDALDPQWRFLDKNKQEMSRDKFPVSRVISTGQDISNIEVGICDSSSDAITWVLCNAYPELDENGEILQVVVTFIDITRQKKDIPFEDIVELASDAILVTEAYPTTGEGPRIVYVNQAFSLLTGYKKSELIGKTPRILQGPDTSPETRAEIKHALESKTGINVQILNYSKTGDTYWLDINIVPLKNEFKEVTFFAAIERDITEFKEQEFRLKQLTIKDPLTSLFNRRGFLEAAESAFDYSIRHSTPLTMAMIDIDYFKKINDTHGHSAGDVALQRLSTLMHKYFRKSDVVGRLGGEEFGIILPQSSTQESLEKLNGFMKKLSSTPLEIKSDINIKLTISVGISTREIGVASLDELTKMADLALYDAKHAGRNRICIFQPHRSS